MVCTVNMTEFSCNAYSNMNFSRSAPYCANTGELTSVIDHEFAHNLDYWDNGNLSSPSETYADWLPMLNFQKSCLFEGWYNVDYCGCNNLWTCPSNSQIKYYRHCLYSSDLCYTECIGAREHDYEKIGNGIPLTPLNHNCLHCGQGTADPCGTYNAHCAGAPAAEAIWDLSARDLQFSPFNYDKLTAFQFGIRLAFIASSNVGNWYSCDCSSSSDGCNYDSGYLSWLAADDDDGNLNNGTPHMSAIYNAFNRHEIACSDPQVIDYGCSYGPITSANLIAEPGLSNNSIELLWTEVANASQYHILRTEENPKGCDAAKIKIATVSDTYYTDTEVLDGVTYYYTICLSAQIQIA